MKWAIKDKYGKILERNFETEKEAKDQRSREIYFGNYDYNNSTIICME